MQITQDGTVLILERDRHDFLTRDAFVNASPWSFIDLGHRADERELPPAAGARRIFRVADVVVAFHRWCIDQTRANFIPGNSGV